MALAGKPVMSKVDAQALSTLIEKLDDELPLVAPEEAPSSSDLTFFIPGTWESHGRDVAPRRRAPEPTSWGGVRVLIRMDDAAPFIGFMFAMAGLGAMVAAFVFGARIAPLW
jgi:hypothetical protein